jgi:hypothetical protein
LRWRIPHILIVIAIVLIITPRVYDDVDVDVDDVVFEANAAAQAQVDSAFEPYGGWKGRSSEP